MADEELTIRTPTGAEVQPMSREQWIEKLALDLQAPAYDVAARVVDDMLRRGVLVVGPRRRWTVVHDDPQALTKYEIPDIYAPTPALAAARGAVQAVLADPYATMGAGAWHGREATMGEREQVARSLVEAGIGDRYCTVTETTNDEEVASDGEAGE